MTKSRTDNILTLPSFTCQFNRPQTAFNEAPTWLDWPIYKFTSLRRIVTWSKRSSQVLLDSGFFFFSGFSLIRFGFGGDASNTTGSAPGRFRRWARDSFKRGSSTFPIFKGVYRVQVSWSSRVVLEGDQATESTYLLKADWAAGSTY